MKATIPAASVATPIDPHRNPRLERLFNERGIKFTFDPTFPIGNVIFDESVQVRLGTERAPKASVDAYAVAVSNGAQLPGIILTEDYRLGDGNTRLGAYSKLKREYIPAYILSDVSDDAVRLLALEENHKHGTRMKEAETRAQIVLYVTAHPDEAVQTDAWAKSTGYHRNKIGRWAKAGQFDSIAVRNGIDPTAKALSDTVKAELLALNSEALITATTDIVSKADLSVREARAVIADVKDGSKASEGEALRRVDTQRAALADRIASGGTLGKRPNALTSWKMHLGYLAKNVKAVDLDLAASELEREEILKRVRDVQAVLEQVVAHAGSTEAAA